MPAPRSGFQLCSDGASGMYMYGGYFKTKVPLPLTFTLTLTLTLAYPEP